MLASHQVKKPEHSKRGAACMTLEEQGGVNEKNVGADQAKKKLEDVPSSKNAIQPGKQMGSNGPAIEGERQCPYCAVICLSSSDLANHNKFWHSNISTKSESVTGSKEKEKAQVVQSRRNLRQQNLSNFRGYKCYRCPHCPAMCDSQAQLNAHMSLCHSNASRPVENPAAPVVSAQTGDNRRKMGANNNHLTCNQCGFTCELEAQLMVHMKKHQHSNIQQQFKQTLSMNQRKHQEMAYQQKVKLGEIKQLKGKLDDIKQLQEMQGILTDMEEFGKGCGSKWSGPDERKMMQPGGKRSADESDGLFSRRTEQVHSQGWQPKVVKDYSKVVKDYSKEPKIKQADPPQADLSCALKKQKTEFNNFERREGEVFQPKVFNYLGSGAPGGHKKAEGVEKPELEEAVFGEEVDQGMSGKKEVVSNVEKSEDHGGGHWRKRLVGLC